MTIATMLPDVQVGEPSEAGGLQVFPLAWRPGEAVNYITLDEALEAGLLEVGEITEGGSVPQLRLTNNGKLPVFLMAGEHLSGGKQNRVLNASLLAAAESSLPIPVSCVERGRWGYRSAHFAGSGTASHSTLRKMMHSQVTMSYRSTGTATSDQGEVWKEVDRKLAETGSSSDTAYLHKAYEDTLTILAPTIEGLPVPEGAHGAVFAYGGKVVGFDLFDRPSTLARLWPKLIRAYATDAHAAEEAKPLDVAAVRQWLGGASGCKEEVFPSPGLGEDVRLEGPALEAACLRVEGHPIHVEAFSR
jgi:hypothetical protein